MNGHETRARAGEPSRKPRRDAAENRRRLIASARRLLGAGNPVPARELAEDADVSVATLYRHFPAREDLLAAAGQAQALECEAAFDRATRDPDPARGIRSYLRHTFAVQSAGIPFRGEVDAERRDRFRRELTSLVARARETGAVRPDLTPGDVLLVLTANAGVTAAYPADRAAHSRRLADIALTGLGLSRE